VGLQISIRESGDVTILDLRGRSTIDGGESELLSSRLKKLVANERAGRQSLNKDFQCFYYPVWYAPAAQALFEDYAKAAMEHFEATEKLSGVVGQHGPFNEQNEYTERAREKCNAARLALEQHWAQHSCRETGEEL
jgi:hypothetical protein